MITATGLHDTIAELARFNDEIELVAWAGEEPRFGAACVGSRAAAGRLERADLDRLRDRGGPSAGGIGPHPDEYTAPEDLENGARVLAGTPARLAA